MLLDIGMTEAEAETYVRDVRRGVLAELEERIYGLEGRIASHAQGPVVIPDESSPMRDHWDALRERAGRWIGNFQVEGFRLFTSGKDGDSLDAFLERYDPGSVNSNDACEMLAADLASVIELRRQRVATIRDGVPDAKMLADDPWQLAAMSGPIADAVLAVREVDEEALLEGHYRELAVLAGMADTLAPPCHNILDVPTADPVGIKEIADRLGVQRNTVDVWLNRKIMPPTRWTVGGRPCWQWTDIEAWARSTGRLENP